MVFTMVIIAIAINISMARYHAYLILKEKRIIHGLWGALYLLAIYLLWNNWLFILNSLFIRKVFFDIYLNYFRGLPLFYVSTKTTSILDKLHNKLFGKDSQTYLTIYFALFLLLTCYLMIKY